MTDTQAGLLPCPFCGPTPAKPEVWRDDYGYVRVTHGPCGSSTGTRPKSDPDGEAKVVALWNTRALQAGAAVQVPEDYRLPCDVMLPPATTIRKGCKLSTLLLSIRQREGLDGVRFTVGPAAAPQKQGA